MLAMYLSYGSLLFLLVLKCTLHVVQSSMGDRSRLYQECYQSCTTMTCHNRFQLRKFKEKQPWTEKLLLWDCDDECRYSCMWYTVDGFVKRGENVPQFNGKWPFVRIFGVQEPASMVFSILNAMGHILGFRIYLREIPQNSLLFYPSVGFFMMSVNAWFWSTVFHSRDTPLTEKMDYFSATALILYSIYYCICRMSLGLTEPDIKRGGLIRKAAFFGLAIFFLYHISYLAFFHFDYGYNMFVNVVAGLTNGALWVLYHFLTKNTFSHQWRATFAVLYTLGLLSLEILDFPPIWWTFDGHALWHLGTIAFPALWYPFMVDESSLNLQFKIA